MPASNGSPDGAEHFDIAIIGAGPAGMECASTLKGRGLATVVLDEQPTPGGQVWRNIEQSAVEPQAKHIWSDHQRGLAAVRAFRQSGATYLPETQLWQIEEGWRLFTRSGGRTRILTADYLVLAVGAYERPIPFEGWQKFGVTTVGAAQILLKTSRIMPSGNAWILGGGPLVEFFSHQMRRLGTAPRGILSVAGGPPRLSRSTLAAAASDPASLFKGAGWLAGQRLAGVRRVEVTAVKATGEDRVTGLEITTSKGREVLPCDLLLVHDGLLPRTHEAELARQISKTPFVCTRARDATLAESRLALAGDVAGIAGASAAVLQGRLTGLALAEASGKERPGDAALAQTTRTALDRELRFRRFLDSYYPPAGAGLTLSPDTLVCRCEEVTAGAIAAAAEVAADLDQLKQMTRAGMGRCQGRNCASTVRRCLRAKDTSMESYRARPPLRPVTLAEIASLED